MLASYGSHPDPAKVDWRDRKSEGSFHLGWLELWWWDTLKEQRRDDPWADSLSAARSVVCWAERKEPQSAARREVSWVAHSAASKVGSTADQTACLMVESLVEQLVVPMD